MLERELKFHVPARQRAALKAHLRKLGAQPIELHARYYDTREQTLARAGIALRVRREGEAWVQTIKTPGPDELSRVEWNHPRPGPTLDLSVYAATHIGPLIETVADQLRCRYVTQVVRMKKVVPTESGSAELAYDEGAIIAGGIVLPIHELELEGIDGATSDLFALSREWLMRHRLVLELRSKAARGDALAELASRKGLDTAWEPDATALNTRNLRARHPDVGQVERLAAPVRSNPPTLPHGIGIRAAYLACANECMSQILRNSSFLAGVDGMKPGRSHRIDYVHQIRVGIRRLRTCWKLYGDAVNPPHALQADLTRHFRALGQARDLDVIQTEVLPRLMQAGMPPDTEQADLPPPGTEAAARSQYVGAPEFQGVLLDLLEHLVLFGDALQADDDTPAAPLLSKRLNAWLNAIRRQSPGFLEADWDTRHRLRKRVKRLRYAMEFTQGLLDAGRLAPLRDALVSAQKSLGHLNDLYVAAEYYRGDGARHPCAMFALGWLAATQEHEARAAHVALHALAAAGNFRFTDAKPTKRGKRKS